MHTGTHSRMRKHACTNPQPHSNTRACTNAQARIAEGSDRRSVAAESRCRCEDESSPGADVGGIIRLTSADYSQSCRARRCGCMQQHATSATHSKVHSRCVPPSRRRPHGRCSIPRGTVSPPRDACVRQRMRFAPAAKIEAGRRLFPVAMSCTVLQHVVLRCNVAHCGQRRRRSRPTASSSPAGSRRSCGCRRSSTTSTSASLRSRPSASASAPKASSCRSRAPKPKQSHQHSGLQR